MPKISFVGEYGGEIAIKQVLQTFINTFVSVLHKTNLNKDKKLQNKIIGKHYTLQL